jgi:hypothetical protein
MSGRLQASGAGDRSSVLVSPPTLKMLTTMRFGSSGRDGEPLGVGPALQHRLGVRVAGLRLLVDVVELVEHQERLLQPCCGRFRGHWVVEQVDQRRDVVAAEHRAEQLGRLGAADQRANLAAMRDGGEVARLDLGSVVDAGRHAVRDQLEQGGLFASRRRLQQLDDVGGLLGGEG